MHAHRRTIERKPPGSKKSKIRKRNKTKQKNNVTPEKGNMDGIGNQKRPEYKFAPLVANQLWRVNQHDPSTLALGYLSVKILSFKDEQII